MDFALDDAEVLRTIDQLSAQFFSSLQGGSTSVSKFSETWNAFSQKVQSYHNELTHDTLSRLYSFASTLETVTQGLIDCQATSSGLSDEITSEVSQILDEELTGLSLRGSEPPVEDCRRPSTAYIELAAKWLHQNIHNPYPGVNVKSSIALQSGATKKDVEAWFVDARKRIGWNALRRKRFNNKRIEIVDAATRFLVHNECFLPPVIESELVAIEQEARSLQQRFQESELASRLDSAVKDMTPALKEEANHFWRNTRVKRPYPTPERSPQRSEAISLPSPSSSICTLPESPSPCPGFKRRLSIDRDDDVEFCKSSTAKRPRLDNSQPQSDNFGHIGLPSPARSDARDLDECNTIIDCVAPITSQSQPTKRKRRLSESNGDRPLKRTNTRQVVSNPLPSTAPAETDPAASDWISQLLSCIPSMDDIHGVSTDALDPTVPLCVEPFDFESCNALGILSSGIPNASLTAATLSTQSTPQPDAVPFDLANTLPLDWLSYDFSCPLTTNQIPSASFDDYSFNPFTLGDGAESLSSFPSFSVGLPENSQDPPNLPMLDTNIPPPSGSNTDCIIRPSITEKELKLKKLQEYEAQCNALRAELAAIM